MHIQELPLYNKTKIRTIMSEDNEITEKSGALLLGRTTSSGLKVCYGNIDMQKRMKAMLFSLKDSLRTILKSNMDKKKKLEKNKRDAKG